MGILDLLAQVPLFQGLPMESLERLASGSKLRFLPAETQLIRQGEPSDCMYVVIKGSVRVERGHPLLTEPVVIGEIGAGEPVGEMGVLDGGPRSATVITAEDTEVLELSAAVLGPVVLASSEVAGALLRILSRRVRTTDELAAALSAQAPIKRARRRRAK